MRAQFFANACVAAFLGLALAACSGGFSTGGSSSTGGTGTGGGTTTATPAHINLAASAGSVAGTGTVTLTATVTDKNFVAIPGTPVSFTSSQGVLTVSGTVTGSNNTVNTGTGGIATATLSNTGVATGTNITVTAAAGGLSSSTTIQTTAAPNLELGSYNSQGVFQQGAIQVGQSTLSAGGSTGLAVVIYDAANNVPFSGGGSVTFVSTCSLNNLATIVSPVTSITATFDSTYTATGCATTDNIVATATVNGSTLPTAQGSVTVQAATLGSLYFDIATTEANSTVCSSASGQTLCTIGLQGTGLNETAPIFFKVLDSNGNAIAGQTVKFSFPTTQPSLGVTLSPTSAVSNGSGEVETIVSSGTIHGSVRVVASATTASGVTISSQSSALTVSTGFPAQATFSLAATVLNLVGDDIDGNTSIITARLADRYNNPVPDGTAVSFTTECGQIQSSCNTVGGACSVTFTTANPRTGQLASATGDNGNPTRTYVDNSCAASPGGTNASLGCNDHRCTILAYAVGEESFNDCNGTGTFISKGNTANNGTQCPNGDTFVSLPDAWIDSNESGVFNGDFETYIDFNHTGTYQQANGEFIGLLCNDPLCDTSQSSLNDFQELVLVLSSNAAQTQVYQEPFNFVGTALLTPAVSAGGYVEPAVLGTGNQIIPNPDFGYSCFPVSMNGCSADGFETYAEAATTPIPPATPSPYGPQPGTMSIAPGCAGVGVVYLGDSQWQVPAVGTTVSLAIASGGAGGTVSVGANDGPLPNTDQFGYVAYGFAVTAPATLPAGKNSDTLIVTTTVPGVTTTNGSFGPLTTTQAFGISYTTGPLLCQ